MHNQVSSERIAYLRLVVMTIGAVLGVAAIVTVAVSYLEMYTYEVPVGTIRVVAWTMFSALAGLSLGAYYVSWQVLGNELRKANRREETALSEQGRPTPTPVTD